MKVLVDTNVLISFALSKSATSSVRRAVIFAATKGNEILVSTHTIDELETVMRRKFPKHVERFRRVLDELDFLLIESGAIPENVSIRDPKDLPILAAAISGRADVLVTGDKDFLADDVRAMGVEIMTPAEFVARYCDD